MEFLCTCVFSPIYDISTEFTLRVRYLQLDNEFRCLEKDSTPSDHILNESESVGGLEMMADFSEISRHILHINRRNVSMKKHEVLLVV